MNMTVSKFGSIRRPESDGIVKKMVIFAASLALAATVPLSSETPEVPGRMEMRPGTEEGQRAPDDSLTSAATSFRNVIHELSGYSVLDWNGEESAHLLRAAEIALMHMNREGVEARRVNEVGNAVEAVFRDALRKSGFQAEIPTTSVGRRKATGYPDIQAHRAGADFYIEVKTYNLKNRLTTQRSFYVSPSDEFKVTRDAFHLVVAFAMEQGEDGEYRALSAEWLNLFELKIRLKLEYNSSNRDLYGDEAGLVAHALEAPVREKEDPKD